MVEKEVEIKRTVTESEKVLICDNCQREVDQNGVEFGAKGNHHIDDIHFCSECTDTFVDQDVNPEYIEEAKSWLNKEWQTHNINFEETLEESISRAFNSLRFFFFTGIVLGFILIGSSVAGLASTQTHIIALTVYSLGALGALFLSAKATKDAKYVVDNAIEDLRNT